MIASAEPIWVDPLITFFAVILGAALTLGISWYFEQKKKNEADLAQAYGLMFKIQSYVDEIVKFEQAIESAIKKNVDGPLWRKLDRLVGFDKKIEQITSKEFALISRTGNQNLAMGIMQIESGHRIINSMYQEHLKLRETLENFDIEQSFANGVVTTQYSKNENPKIDIVHHRLNGISEHIEQTVPDISNHSRKVANEIGPFLKEQYRFNDFITLVFP